MPFCRKPIAPRSTASAQRREREKHHERRHRAAHRQAGAVTRAHVHASLGEILAGTRPGRTDEQSITLFDSTGMGLQDVAAAFAIYRRALEAGAGTRLSLT
jgi:ornithine cyclodeaminase/alanine dehydrogenase-like protein (mu-crystallin family)